MAETNSVQSGEAAAEPEHDTQDRQMTKLAEKMDAASLFLTPEQQDCVTLKAGGKSFTFKKIILIQHSKYFAACLKNKTFVEGQTLTVEFDDVDPTLLGLYLHVACTQATTDAAEFDPGIMKEPKRLKPTIDLYNLADRFMNTKMTALLGPAITFIAMSHSLRNPFGVVDQEAKVWQIKNYKEAFEALDKEDGAHAYIRESLVACYCRCIPLDNFEVDLQYLEDNPEFMRMIMIRLAELQTKAKKNGWADNSHHNHHCGIKAKLPSHWGPEDTNLSHGIWQNWH